MWIAHLPPNVGMDDILAVAQLQFQLHRIFVVSLLLELVLFH